MMRRGTTRAMIPALALVFAGCVVPPYEVGSTTTGTPGTTTDTGSGGGGGGGAPPDIDEPTGTNGAGAGGGSGCDLTLCGDACVDVKRDRAHCGGCSNACSFGPCKEGQCMNCPEHDLADCGDTCADLATSEEHCGMCGNACPGGCQNGSCVTGFKRPEP